MNKRQLIEAIRAYNTSVRTTFLSQFDEVALNQYLQHLRAATLRNVRIAGWIRRRPLERLAS